MTRIYYDQWDIEFKPTKNATPPSPLYEIGQLVHREHWPGQYGVIESRNWEVWHDHEKGELPQGCSNCEDSCWCHFIGAWFYTIRFASGADSRYEEDELCLLPQAIEKLWCHNRWQYDADKAAQAVARELPMASAEAIQKVRDDYEARHVCEEVHPNRSEAMRLVMERYYQSRWINS